MKTKILLVASFILAIGMTGCSNSMDDETPLPSTKGEDVLIVKLPDNVKYTRGVEESVDGMQTIIDDVVVFLLTGESVERVETLSDEDILKGEKRFEQVPSQVNNVIVVANVNGMAIADLKNANAILNYEYDVLSQHTKTELKGRTLMGRANAVTVNPEDGEIGTPDGHLYKQADVKLRAITARIEVGAVVAGEGVESVELVSIYLNNFYAYYPSRYNLFFDEDHEYWYVKVEGNNPGVNIASKDPIGTVSVITEEGPSLYRPAPYQINGSTSVTATAGSNVYAFHVFPDALPHVIMLVKLELKKDYYEVDENNNPLKYKYGFVTFSKYKESTQYIQSMEAHHVYKMGVGASGIPINAKDITDKPEKGPYDLGVNIKIDDWDLHNVTPEV